MLGIFRRSSSGMNRARFEREVLACLPDLYRSASAMLGQPADAEDLVHDACLKAFAGFDQVSLENTQACQGWLRKILVNSFRDRYRRERRSPIRDVDAHSSGDEDSVIELAMSLEPLPEDRLAELGFAHALDLVLGAMPPEVRTVAVLHMVNGVAYKDIATITDCPIGTVMSRLARARKVLRKHLRHHFDGESLTSKQKGKG